MKQILLSILLTGVLSAQGSKPAHKTGAAKSVTTKSPSALDKKTFETYVRHLFVWPDDIALKIDDPAPSPIPGFVTIKTHASQGKASQEEVFYVSKDGKQILRGSVYEVAKNPFAEQLSEIKTDQHASFGTPGAPVVVVEFSDFQCHYCKEEAKVLRDNLLKEYPKDVRFYFVDFPLETLHPWALAASIAGRCVYKQSPGAFWDFHDWMFASQEQITGENLKDKVLDWAKSKGLDPQPVSACIDTKATEPEIRAGIEMGAKAGVNSTPTTFINGRPLAGQRDWVEVKRVIDFEIGYQATAKNAGENCGCSLEIPKTGVK